MATVASAGERALIDRIRARLRNQPSFLTLGIGDDAAVIEPSRGELDVITTDSLVEDVHFRRAWTAATDIGVKAVAVNFSDLAAMGATPRAVLLSLALPPALPLADFDALVDGVVSATEAAGAALAGGNLTRSPGPLIVDVVAMGSIRRRRMLRRDGGRAGDQLYITGPVGAAAAGLGMLEAGVERQSLDADARECLARYERPAARLRCGRLVAASRSATAAIDLSDGLAEAVRQLAEASLCGAALTAEDIPVHAGAIAWCKRAGRDPIEFALAGGEDYELLFAVPARRRRAFLAAVGRSGCRECVHIGQLTSESGVWIQRANARIPFPDGFRHF
jgi:thiamine-monophosphate kinase